MLRRDLKIAQLEAETTGTQVGKQCKKRIPGTKKPAVKRVSKSAVYFFRLVPIITYVSTLPTPLLDLKVPKAPDNLLPKMSF